MVEGLTHKQNEKLQELLAQVSGIEKAIIYGSRAKGNFKPGSDIDLTLVGQDLTHKDLSFLMEQYYWSDLPYQLDVSLFSEIDNADLINHIKRVGKVIYEKTIVFSYNG